MSPRLYLCSGLVVVFVIACLSAPVANASLGVDISDLVSTSDWGCLKGQGYTTAIIRGFRSTGSVDPNVVANVNNAKAAGISSISLYFFPDPKAGNPSGQMSTAISYFKSHSVQFETLWLDIEAPSMWLGSTSANLAFIQGLVSTAQQSGVNLGIYTSNSQWQPITGGSTQYSSLPLWYAHYDNNPSFSDFQPFGGWKQPTIKQYAGDKTVCSVDADLDFFGGSSTSTSTHSSASSKGPGTSSAHSSTGKQAGTSSHAGPSSHAGTSKGTGTSSKGAGTSTKGGQGPQQGTSNAATSYTSSSSSSASTYSSSSSTYSSSSSSSTYSSSSSTGTSYSTSGSTYSSSSSTGTSYSTSGSTDTGYSTSSGSSSNTGYSTSASGYSTSGSGYTSGSSNSGSTSGYSSGSTYTTTYTTRHH